ncbi:MAG: hypothetical protein K9I34_01180 [Bacteroidales bacterium]|nr:hypothetical protein [Bacteroidales bacterium]
MRYIFLLIFVYLSFCVEQGVAQRQLLTQGTAFTMNKKDFHLAIFHPSAYALTGKTEFSAMLPAFLVYPNLAWKNNWLKSKHIAIASEVKTWYPSFLLKNISQLPRFESYPSEAEVPQTIGYGANLLLSYGWGESKCPAFTSEEFNQSNRFTGYQRILTLTLGVQSGHVFDTIPFPLIEEGVVFQRTYFLNDGLSLLAGLGFDARLGVRTDMTTDLNFIYLPNQTWAIEHKGGVHLYKGRFFHLLVGYHISYAQTPNRSVFFATPIVDLQWTFHRDKIQYGLFGKKMF